VGGETMNINDINNNINYISSLFSYSDSSKNSNIIEEIGSKYENYLNISSFGKSLNALYNDLKNIDNQADRTAALEGAKNIIISLAKNSDGTELAKFTQSLNVLKEDNTQTFNKLFINANRLNDIHQDIGSWVKTFSNLYSTGFQKDYINETDTILNTQADNSEKLLTINNFINSIDKILNTRFPKEDILKDALTAFFKGLDNSQDLNTKNDYMNNTAENITKGVA
jgi:hypothetical protein